MPSRAMLFLTFLLVWTALLCTSPAHGASVVGSKHDLSTSAPLNEPCAFCHTPHFANQTLAPLWNRTIGSGVTFTPYVSPTMDTTAALPSGVSLACLGCHDGVNSSDDKHALANRPGSGGIPGTSSSGRCAACHTGGMGIGISNALKIGTDLKNDHPVSMTYPTAAQDPAFRSPQDIQQGWSDVPLFSGKVECPSCHNVHNPDNVPFLRISNAGSALCYKCHDK